MTLHPSSRLESTAKAERILRVVVFLFLFLGGAFAIAIAFAVVASHHIRMGVLGAVWAASFPTSLGLLTTLRLGDWEFRSIFPSLASLHCTLPYSTRLYSDFDVLALD